MSTHFEYVSVCVHFGGTPCVVEEILIHGQVAQGWMGRLGKNYFLIPGDSQLREHSQLPGKDPIAGIQAALRVSIK